MVLIIFAVIMTAVRGNTPTGIVDFSVLSCIDFSRCRSIAFPAISTGVFGYPVMEATKAIVEAIKDHMQRNPSCSVREIYLCDITKSNSLLCFQKHLEELIRDSSVTKPAEDSTIYDITKFIESTKMDRHYAETIPKHAYEPTNFQGKSSGKLLIFL